VAALTAVAQPVLAGPGQRLGATTRTLMERRLGHDLSDVRIHTDAVAAQAAQALWARAWTLGSHVAFAAGEYRPHETRGRLLLAHELAHVVQQTGAPDADPVVLGDPHGAAERDAEVAAAQATGDQPWQSQVARGSDSIPSNTVECVAPYRACVAPYSPGSAAAKVTYHCPIWPGRPGTTAPAYVTIPDEFVGKDSQGQDLYRCRPGSEVSELMEIGDAEATAITRGTLCPTQAACHAGFRANLSKVLAGLFEPRGGGRPWGGRVNQAAPRDFTCP
jgi:Domain of unknown function (DUF4157)